MFNFTWKRSPKSSGRTTEHSKPNWNFRGALPILVVPVATIPIGTFQRFALDPILNCGKTAARLALPPSCYSLTRLIERRDTP